MKPVIPSWIKMNGRSLSKLDLGSKAKPFSENEASDGYIIRGPVVIIPSPSTSPKVRKLLPMIAHNIRIFETPTKTAIMQFEKYPDNVLTVQINKRAMMDLKNNLMIETTNDGMVQLRSFKMGDRAFYELGPDFSTNKVDDFIASVWKAWI